MSGDVVTILQFQTNGTSRNRIVARGRAVGGVIDSAESASATLCVAAATYDGAVRVTIPSGGRVAAAKLFALRKLNWIEQQLAISRNRDPFSRRKGATRSGGKKRNPFWKRAFVRERCSQSTANDKSALASIGDERSTAAREGVGGASWDQSWAGDSAKSENTPGSCS